MLKNTAPFCLGLTWRLERLRVDSHSHYTHYQSLYDCCYIYFLGYCSLCVGCCSYCEGCCSLCAGCAGCAAAVLVAKHSVRPTAASIGSLHAPCRLCSRYAGYYNIYVGCEGAMQAIVISMWAVAVSMWAIIASMCYCSLYLGCYSICVGYHILHVGCCSLYAPLWAATASMWAANSLRGMLQSLRALQRPLTLAPTGEEKDEEL